MGIDHRVLYGWVYMSANGISDEAEKKIKLALFSGLAWLERYD